MKNFTLKLLIPILFFANSLHVIAGDTIKFVARPYISFWISATFNKQFTVRCVDVGINEIFTGTGDLQYISITNIGFDRQEIIIEGEEGCAITFFDTFSSLSVIDVSKCPSIEYLYAGSGPFEKGALGSINISNCLNLKLLHITGGCLKELDVSDCWALETIYCNNHNLSMLDINLSNNPAINQIICDQNHLSLW